MNKALRELVYKAKLDNALLWTSDRGMILDYEHQAFAELIIRECADVAYGAYWHDPEFVRGIHILDAIKEHFGVGDE